jgi:hypothetical protein
MLARMDVPLEMVVRMRRSEQKLHNRRPLKPSRSGGGGDWAGEDDGDGEDGDDDRVLFGGDLGADDDDSMGSDEDEEARAKRAKKKKKAPKPSPYGPRWSEQEVGALGWGGVGWGVCGNGVGVGEGASVWFP